MTDTATYYATLHLAPSASPIEVKRAYIRLVKRYHPDRVPAKYKKLAEAKLRTVVEAYHALKKDMPAARKKTAYTPSWYDLKPANRGMGTGNDNRARRVAPFPWRAAAKAGWSNMTEILWPIAPKQQGTHPHG